MEERFSWSHGVTWWLGIVLAVGVAVVLLEGAESFFPGAWLMFVGTGFVLVGAILGSFRTGNWTSPGQRVHPTPFEALVGLTGLTLALCPLVVLLSRVAIAYARHASA
jgi:hypothetical protein